MLWHVPYSSSMPWALSSFQSFHGKKKTWPPSSITHNETSCLSLSYKRECQWVIDYLLIWAEKHRQFLWSFHHIMENSQKKISVYAICRKWNIIFTLCLLFQCTGRKIRNLDIICILYTLLEMFSKQFIFELAGYVLLHCGALWSI